MQIDFCGASYEGRSLNVDPSRSINFFPEISSSQSSKTKQALVGTPGTIDFIDFISGEVRLQYNFVGRLFCIVANELYEVYSNGTKSTVLAIFPDSTGFAVAVDNGLTSNGVGGNQIFIVTNNRGFIYNVDTLVLTEITDAGFPPNPKQVAYLDGYFIVTNDTMGFWTSELYNGLVWPGLAFAAAVATSDGIKRPVSLHQQLFLFKEMTTEVWYNNGTPTSSGSPFVKLQGTVIDTGTPAPRSIAYGGNTVIFLANSRNGDFGEFAGIVIMDGYQASIVSPPAINYRISQFTLSDSFGYCYSDEGHIFYVLTFPTNDATIVYDMTTKLWHERSTYVEESIGIHRHLSNGYTYFNNKHIVSDYRNSKLKSMASSYYDDAGDPIISIRIATPTYDPSELSSLFIHKLVIDSESGVGDGSTGGLPGSIVLTHSGDPQAWLSWSNDGGHTWSDEYSASVGKIGEYKKRLMWRRLGRSRNRVFRLRMIDSVKKVILGAYINDGVIS